MALACALGGPKRLLFAPESSFGVCFVSELCDALLDFALGGSTAPDHTGGDQILVRLPLSGHLVTVAILQTVF